MTNVETRTRAARTPVPRTLAAAAVAMLLALAAPAVSFLPALTTSIHGSGAAVTFPRGYPVMVIVTIAVTAVACALGALVAGLALILAGASLGHHAHLIDWGIALMAATVAGAATGLPLSARR